jgi:hypothetical protein
MIKNQMDKRRKKLYILLGWVCLRIEVRFHACHNGNNTEMGGPWILSE